MYVCVCVCMYVCVCGCMYVCVCVCMYVCMYACIYYSDGGEQTINVCGQIYSLNVSDLQAEEEARPSVGDNPAQEIARVMVGGRPCDPWEGSQGLR